MHVPGEQRSSTDDLKYRPDIDGLRAVAVLAVVVYHAFPRFAPAGFTGVDVFFVISGFLITGIIQWQVVEGQFRFRDFYARRVRRIFPALLVVLAATLAIGWARLFSSEYQQLGKHVAGAAAFASNLVLYTEAGYFDASSHLKPLLHLWSLGVEEQFYLFWPVLLVFVHRLGSQTRAALWLVLVLSFITSLAVVDRNHLAAFYLPMFRCWQLAAGGLLVFAGGRARWSGPRGVVAGLIGAGLILLATLWRVESTRYPGWHALLPTVGTCLLIAAGPLPAINRALAWRPLVALGLISYPLYLWHWPLLTFARIFDGPLPSRSVRAAIVAVSLLLAAMTYVFIERPIRRRAHVTRLAVGLSVAMAIACAAGYAIFVSGGARFRQAAAAAEPYIESSARSLRSTACIDIRGAATRADDWYCHLGTAGQPARTIVIGDSHAASLLPAFAAIARERREDILFVASSGCPPLLGVAPRRHGRDLEACRTLNERAFRLVEQQRPLAVFLVANWTYYTDGNYSFENLSVIGFDQTPETIEGSREAFARGLALTLSRYESLPVNVHVVQRVPVQLRTATDLIRAVVTGNASPHDAIRRVSVPVDVHRRSLTFVSSAFDALRFGRRPRAELIDLEGVYCDSEVCSFGRDGVSYYFDDSHLSESGALLAVPELSRHFQITGSGRASPTDSRP